jgi:hypothetical protein
LLWGLPAAALLVGALLDGSTRTVVWTSAFLVAGFSCVANASRCGRLHCYLTGPLYLLGAVATLLVGFGVVSLGWGWIPGVAISGTVLAFVPEWVRGKYRTKEVRL